MSGYSTEVDAWLMTGVDWSDFFPSGELSLGRSLPRPLPPCFSASAGSALAASAKVMSPAAVGGDTFSWIPLPESLPSFWTVSVRTSLFSCCSVPSLSLFSAIAGSSFTASAYDVGGGGICSVASPVVSAPFAPFAPFVCLTLRLFFLPVGGTSFCQRTDL